MYSHWYMQLVEINLHTHASIVCLFEQIFFTRKIVHNIYARLLRESQMYLEYTFQSQIFLFTFLRIPRLERQIQYSQPDLSIILKLISGAKVSRTSCLVLATYLLMWCQLFFMKYMIIIILCL